MKKEMISFQDITLKIEDRVILNKLNLKIKDAEFITFLGPSGCGKTSILKIIGGFLTPTYGKVFFEQKDITFLPSYKRRVNTIFQNYALFPHMNVYENVAFGMRVQKKSGSEIRKQVEKMLEMVSLEGFSNRNVEELSGGQQQRIAIARALAARPKVLLLDEPLAALDLKLRKDMQTELKNIQQQTGITFVFVTHDQEEALSVSDTVIVMDNGKIQQIGTPIDIYNEPKNAFVADFIGESNIIDGKMVGDYLVNFAGRDFECLDSGFKKNEKVDVVIRPEDIKITSLYNAHLRGLVTSVTFRGVHWEIIVDIDNFKWMIQTTEFEKVGNKIGIILDEDDIHIMRKSEHSGEYGDYSAFSDEMYEEYEKSKP